MTIKKVPLIIAYLSVPASICVKTTWILIAQKHNEQTERAAEFSGTIPGPCLVITAILALYSLFIFIHRFNTVNHLPTRILMIICIALQSAYLFLEGWQFM